MCLPASIGTEDLRTVEMNALIDSRAGGVFIDEGFVKKHRLETMALSKPIKVTNVNRTPNKKGTITEATTLWLKVDGKKIQTQFLVSGLGEEAVILGLPWLRKISPDINWEKGTFRFQNEGSVTIRLMKNDDSSLQECFKAVARRERQKLETEKQKLEDEKKELLE